MIIEIQGLGHNKTWELVPLPSRKKTIGYHWLYAIKVGPNAEVDRLKAQLVAKGYIQIYGLNYNDFGGQKTIVRLFPCHDSYSSLLSHTLYLMYPKLL